MIKIPKEVLTEMKAHLESELTRISAQIADLSAQDPFANTDRLTDNAAVDAEANEEAGHERFQALVTQLQQTKQAIADTLERLNQETYGLCTNCHRLIDTDRLAAFPTATVCIECGAKQ
jgi:DnaK suppressor protein